ncbi:hypothetical protein NHX12_016682 [Muraenolepis orangiensis]|uniref:Uncharacterized protein n=1 Tax=Muraenolepis orangiensis TaxID=630683 RepID=A0A9Q0D816_9TELE|nr:hypothetical protein NHX12_016682 [Muraenolepis orangiensis]
MLQELQGIVLCRDSLQVRRRWGASILRPRPLEERRARAATATAGRHSHRRPQQRQAARGPALPQDPGLQPHPHLPRVPPPSGTEDEASGGRRGSPALFNAQ